MPDPHHDEYDTRAGVRDTPPGPRGRWFRRSGIAFLVLIVVLAALDLLGPRTGSTSDEGGGYRLSVEFPQVTRAGQPASLHIVVERPDGAWGETVQVRLCDELFNDLDFQNWYPAPAAETTSPPWIYYEFDPPPGPDALEISLDARTAPGQFGELDDCRISVLSDDEAVVSVSFVAWRMP